jgi:hypothetical protein
MAAGGDEFRVSPPSANVAFTRLLRDDRAMLVEPDPETIASTWARKTVLLRSDDETRGLFRERAAPILQRHREQSVEQVKALRAKYARPVFGKVRVWELIERLGSCVDPTDERLFCASQQVHVLQMLEAMEHDGTATPEMVLVALIHDLGKVLLLTGEDPANVVCMNGPVTSVEAGTGLGAPPPPHNSMIQWNHDEFAYERLRDHIPEDLAWLIRYHSLEMGAAATLMDDGDLERTDRLLLPFARYDHATKSPFHVPATPLAKYRDVIEEAFPRRIRF